MSQQEESVLEKSKRKRVITGGIYFGIGIVVAIGTLFSILHLYELEFIKQYLIKILWCFSWSAIGIGSSLINSRTRPLEKGVWYYVFCFPFVLFIATLSAFIALLEIDKPALSYTSAALVGIIVGFAGEALPGKMENLDFKGK
jgi:hypothetical protein